MTVPDYKPSKVALAFGLLFWGSLLAFFWLFYIVVAG